MRLIITASTTARLMNGAAPIRVFVQPRPRAGLARACGAIVAARNEASTMLCSVISSPQQFRDDAPVRKYEHPIAFQELDVLGRVPDDQPARAGDLGGQPIEIALGRDIDAAGRIVQEDDRRVGDQRARDQRLLLIAAAEFENARLQPRDVQPQAFRRRQSDRLLLLAGEEPEHRQTGDAAKTDVRQDAPEREDALAQPIAGNEAARPVPLDRRKPVAARLENEMQQFLLAVAFEPGQSDDFALRAIRSRGRAKATTSPAMRTRTAADAKSAATRSVSGNAAASPPIIRTRSATPILARFAVPDERAIAQHRDLLGDVDDLERACG